jgi:hypothetical protein
MSLIRLGDPEDERQILGHDCRAATFLQASGKR